MSFDQIYIRSDWSHDFAEENQKPIGRGSFGKVYLVRSKESGKYYALKKISLLQPVLKMSVLNQTYALDEGTKLIQLGLQHDNILTYHKAYLYNDHVNWLMDYCDGGTLKDRIRVYIKSNKQFDENLIWYWSTQILNGIEFLHSNGIIHRDLKPDNIYIESKFGTCKIGDFGFAKVIGDATTNENTTINVIKSETDEVEESVSIISSSCEKTIDDLEQTSGVVPSRHIIEICHTRDDAPYQKEAKIAYKLINISQVGTPSYMAPEMRLLVESHLNYCSIQTVEKATRLCEKHVIKGDIFSFGCIVYEMAVLRMAFENKFSLPTAEIKKKTLKLDKYSSDLKTIIELALSYNPEDRPSVYELLENSIVKKRLNDNHLSSAYKSQITPSINLNANFAKKNVLECQHMALKECYKPISIKSLKFNQNFVVVLLNKHMNMQRVSAVSVGEGIQRFTSKLQTFITREESQQAQNQNEDYLESTSSDYIDESMFAVYNQYCQLVKEIDTFTLTNNSRELLGLFGYMRFKSYDFCVDEENDHLYLSTLKHGIMRFRISKINFYFEELTFDGRLDLNSELSPSVRIFPTCMVLIENEEIFGESRQTNQISKRRLIFFDRNSRRLIQLQAQLHTNVPSSAEAETPDSIISNRLIKCNINAGLTLNSKYNLVKQMINTNGLLICLFEDQSLVNVYNLRTLQIMRSNEQNVKANMNSICYNLCCIAIDSENNLYSTNGKHIFNYDYEDFKINGKRIKPVVLNGQDLSQIICLMSILTNGKLALLTDALQDETSQLYILNPVSRSRLNREVNA